MLVIESHRDRQVLEWLVAQVGEAAVAAACCEEAGARRAYSSNVAKVLGLRPPAVLALASEQDARRQLEAIAAVLGMRPEVGGRDGEP